MATKDLFQMTQKCRHEIGDLVNALHTPTNEKQWSSLLKQIQDVMKDSQWDVLHVLKSVILKMKSVSSLKNLMQIFIMKTSDLIANNDVLESESLSSQCFTLLKDFWSLSSNQHNSITKQMFGVYNETLCDVLPSMASLYIDLYVASYKYKEKTEHLSKRLYGWLNLDLNGRCLKTALLEVSQCTSKTASFLLPILRKILTPPPQNSFMDYLLHFVLLRRWSLVSKDLADVVQVNLNVKAPKNFADWLCQRWHQAREYIPQDKSLKGRRVSDLMCNLDSEAVEDLIDVFSQCLLSEEDQGLKRDTSNLEDGAEVADLFVIDKSGSGQDGPPSRKRQKLDETSTLEDTSKDFRSKGDGMQSYDKLLSHPKSSVRDKTTKNINSRHNGDAKTYNEDSGLVFTVDRTAGKRKHVYDKIEIAGKSGKSQEEGMEVEAKRVSKSDSKSDSSDEEDNADENVDTISIGSADEFEKDESIKISDEETNNDKNVTVVDEDDAADSDKENEDVEIVDSNDDENAERGDDDDDDENADSDKGHDSNETDENGDDTGVNEIADDDGDDDNVDTDQDDHKDESGEEKVQSDSGEDEESTNNKEDDSDTIKVIETVKIKNVGITNSTAKSVTKFPVCEKDPALCYFANLIPKEGEYSNEPEVQVINNTDQSPERKGEKDRVTKGSPSGKKNLSKNLSKEKLKKNPQKDKAEDTINRINLRLRSESESSQSKKFAKTSPAKSKPEQKKIDDEAQSKKGNTKIISENETVAEKGVDQIGLMLSQIRNSLNDGVPIPTRHSTRLRTKSESSDVQSEVKCKTKAGGGRRQTLTGIKPKPETSANIADKNGPASMLSEWLIKPPYKANDVKKQKTPQKEADISESETEHKQSIQQLSSGDEISVKKTPRTYTGSSKKRRGSPQRILIESGKSPSHETSKDESHQRMGKEELSSSVEDEETNKLSETVDTKTPKSVHASSKSKNVQSRSGTTDTPKTKKTPVQKSQTPNQRRKYFLRGTSPVISPTDNKQDSSICETPKGTATSSLSEQKVARKSPAERRKSLRSSSKQH